MSAMPSVSEKPTDRAAVLKKPAVVKKPATVKKPAAAVKKRPAAALLARSPCLSETDSEPSEPRVPHRHRHLSIDGFAGAHLEDLGPQHAGEVVLEAMAALRRTVQPDRSFSFSVPDPRRTLMRRFVLDRCTSPVGTYELEVELTGSAALIN